MENLQIGTKIWFNQTDLQCSYGTIIKENYDGFYTVIEDETNIIWIIDVKTGIKKII